MIERTRKRPRVKSVRFRTFWWLLTVEAALRIYCTVHGHGIERVDREAFVTMTGTRARTFGRAMLKFDRGRRFWP